MKKILLAIVIILCLYLCGSVVTHVQVHGVQEHEVRAIYYDNGGNHVGDEQEMEIVKLVNEYRAEAGIHPLKWDEKLAEVAQLRADEMAASGYFEHERPNHQSWTSAYNEVGVIYKRAAENIARGFAKPKTVVAAWMASEGHRKNIMNPNLDYIGVGISRHYYAQEFIAKNE